MGCRNVTGALSELEGLESSIYEAASGLLEWHTVLRDIARIADGAAAVLVSEAGICSGSYDHAPSVEQWIQDIGSLTKRTEILSRIRGTATTNLKNLTPRSRSNAGHCHCAAARIGDDCAIILLRTMAVPFEDRLLRVVDRLHPHLERAVRLANTFALSRARQVIDAFTVLGLPTVILDELGCPIVGNDLLRPLYPSVLQAEEDRLVVGDPKVDLLLRRIFSETVREPSTVRSIALSARQTRAPYALHLIPLSQTRISLTRSARWALVVTSARELPVPRRSVLAAIFDLTPAEARVAQLLAGSKAADEIAESLKIGRETARTHIKSVFEKAGVRRHVDFVRKVASLHSLPLLGIRTHL